MRMNNGLLKRTLLMAFAAWVLSISDVQAQQAAPDEMEALKKQIQEVISQNADLKKRVRDLEEAMKARVPAEGATPATGTTQVGGAPTTPTDPAAPEALPGPARTVREKIQLGGAI